MAKRQDMKTRLGLTRVCLIARNIFRRYFCLEFYKQNGDIQPMKVQENGFGGKKNLSLVNLLFFFRKTPIENRLYVF